eukprot:scaffold42202_cov55-Attheya_sp.AAC.4
MTLRTAFAISVMIASCDGFVTPRPRSAVTSTQPSTLYFGIPTFGGGPKKDEEPAASDPDVPEKKIDFKGLMQLVTAGMGSPFLGDYEGVDEETGNLMFSLEANNLVDEEGNSKQTQAAYFESGWVSEEDSKKDEDRKKKGGFKLW